MASSKTLPHGLLPIILSLPLRFLHCDLLALLQIEFARAQDRQFRDLVKVAFTRHPEVGEALAVELLPDLRDG